MTSLRSPSRFASSTLLLIIISVVASHELCFDLNGAIQDSNPFCSDYSGYTCCTTAQDTDIQNTINALGVTDPTCLAYITKTSCSKCDPWGAHLFGVEDKNPRDFPELCDGYCPGFYQACGGVTMNWPQGKNPFNSTLNVLNQIFPTQQDFCNFYKPLSADTACYNGTKFVPKSAPPPEAGSDTLCFERFRAQFSSKLIKLADPHDNSGKLYAAYQNGTILALDQVTGANKGLLLTLPAYENGEAGLLGLAFHPKFSSNGKFYVFWSSQDKTDCSSDDWCNGLSCTNGKCEGTAITNRLQEYHYTAGAAPTLSRTMIEVAKPFGNHNGGDVIFGPDGYLYLGLGDGGSANDPYNNAQNMNRRLGKILRFDVDSTNYVSGRQYAVPSDNPFQSSTFPEIFAYGLRNPWRMSFDAFRPSYFFVADVGQDYVEEVDLVVRGGNYGWPSYEGVAPTKTKDGKQVIANRLNPIFEYYHNQTQTQGPSVTGGYLYRGSRDPCQYGKYIFADWTTILFSASETSRNSGSYSYDVTKRYSAKCASKSASCDFSGGYQSFSQDDSGDLYLLTTKGTFRLVEPSRCGVTCNAVIPSADLASNSFKGANTNPAGDSEGVSGSQSTVSANSVVYGPVFVLVSLAILFLSY